MRSGSLVTEDDERRTLDLQLDLQLDLEHVAIERTLLLPVEARAPRVPLAAFVEEEVPPFVPDRRRRALQLGATLVALSLAITLVVARMGETAAPAPKPVPMAAFP